VSARRTRDGSRLSHALGNLALVEALTGNPAEATAYVRENLELQRERGERRQTAEALVVAAAIVATRRDHEAAGRLMGAAEAMYEAGGSDLNEFERRILHEHVFTTMDAETSAALSQARTSGRSMTVFEAIDSALQALTA
jgi:hypothetical protein